jgi:hypothetical protein
MIGIADGAVVDEHQEFIDLGPHPLRRNSLSLVFRCGLRAATAAQPASRRIDADEKEEIAHLLFSFLAGGIVSPPDTLKLALRRSIQSDYFGVCVELTGLDDWLGGVRAAHEGSLS